MPTVPIPHPGQPTTRLAGSQGVWTHSYKLKTHPDFITEKELKKSGYFVSKK